jgi:thiamine biosynthesis protein ThiS
LRVYVNGDIQELGDGLFLLELISLLELPSARIAVELNREVVRRKDWSVTVLKEEDRIEIVHFVGGGCEIRFNRGISVESKTTETFLQRRV